MARSRNTDKNGKAFSMETRRKVWKKGKVINGEDSSKRRRDDCKALIEWGQYGNTSNSKGWEIDHIKPVAEGGGDELSNLQPLQWENNKHKSDDWLNWTCHTS